MSLLFYLIERGMPLDRALNLSPLEGAVYQAAYATYLEIKGGGVDGG